MAITRTFAYSSQQGEIQSMFERSAIAGTKPTQVSRLPSFIHVGPPRTGTTWLHEVLKGYVGLPDPKETRFFDDRYDLGMDWYSNLFDVPTETDILGEFYPGYFANPIAMQRIKKHIPNCKIICTFRDPATRLYSLWRVIRARRLVVEPSFDRFWRLIVARGFDLPRYAAHLRDWQREFGESNVLTLFYEDLRSNPQGYLNTICDFLGVDRLSLDKSSVGKTTIHDAPRAVRITAISRFAGASYWWLSTHGLKSFMSIGLAQSVKNRLQKLFVEQFEPLDALAAEEIRRIALSDIESLEDITGRDLRKWKPNSYNSDLQVAGDGGRPVDSMRSTPPL
jgi:hypothetical protein